MFFSKEATFNTFFENSIYEIVEREKAMSLGYQEKCEEKRKKIPKTGGKMSMNESTYGYATFHA